MPKKTHIAQVPPEPDAKPKRISPQDHMELMRHEHQAELARVRLQLAQSCERAVRLEIAQAAQAAAEGMRRAQDALKDSTRRHTDFAQQLAERYDFAWSTHTYCPDTGIVRRVTED